MGYGSLKGGEMALATYDPDACCAWGTDIIAEFSGDDPGELMVLGAIE